MIPIPQQTRLYQPSLLSYRPQNGSLTAQEMMTGPKKGEYLALIAPPGNKGLYLGYVNIPVRVGVFLGSWIAGLVYGRYGE
jgi:hypothetical protein